jgi:hypothetical protein
MPKKSESGNGNNANKAHFPKQDHDQNPGQKNRPDNASGHQQQPEHAGGRSQEALERNMEKDKARDQKKMDGIMSKKGCFPKLFMLILPFAAIGTYFLIR